MTLVSRHKNYQRNVAFDHYISITWHKFSKGRSIQIITLVSRDKTTIRIYTTRGHKAALFGGASTKTDTSLKMLKNYKNWRKQKTKSINTLKEFSDYKRGVMVSVFASSAVDRGFESRSSQTKDYNIGMCCFFAKHAALRRKTQRLVGRESE